MKGIVDLEVSHLRKIRRLRDKVAEDIVREHIHEFFFERKPPITIKKDDIKITVDLHVINPIKNLMCLFRETKIKGNIKKYRTQIIRLIKAISEMSVTPDLALILIVYVFAYSAKHKIPFLEEADFNIALVEIKRGKADLRSHQKKDVQKAEEAGIPYYLVRVDDSNFLKGIFSLKGRLLTPKLELLTPICYQNLKCKKMLAC